MPNFTVKVTFIYPVSAVNAEDALATVPQVIKMRYVGVHAQGLCQIIDDDGKDVLTAVLNPDKEKIPTK